MRKNLVHLVEPASGKPNFRSDGDGGRVHKLTPSSLTTYLGQSYEVHQLAGSPVSEVKKHIFLGATRICTVNTQTGQPANPQTNYYHTDHLGSSNIITDETGQQTQLLEYTPYGETWRQEGSTDVTHKFTGKELDNTGLYFYGARYYDPEIGRFITADTIIQAPYDPQSLNRYSYCRNNPLNYVDPTGHWSWRKFAHSFAGAFVGALIAGILTGGFGFGLAAAGFWGGMAGGAVTGGLEGGWRGALMGAAIGGALGALGGWGIGNFGAGFGYGMLSAGAGYAGATDSWDSFAGGLTGGIAGYSAGSGFGKSEQFQNWKAGNGFRSNRGVRAAEYEKALDSLSINESDKVKVSVGSRPLAKDAAGNPGGPTGPRHRYLRWTENGQERIWEMGPQKGAIQTRNTAVMNDWDTAVTTDLSIGTPYAKEVTIEMSLSGLKNAISTYESFWVGQPYGKFSYNSNYAVNSVLYGDKANVPGGLGFTPGLPASP